MPTALWWGRFDPDYARNRILRALLAELGWRVVDFHPLVSAAGDLEAALRRLPAPDLVWVPCFRQRDLAAARRWSRARGVPLLFDPLISAYDKQVYERAKYPPESHQARRLHAWEQRLFQSADLVLADTPAHAEYYAQEFGLDPSRLKVVYVGAEEPLFHPEPMPESAVDRALEVLFYGSFIALQGPEVIVEAARCYRGPPVHWVLLGEGPLRERCRQMATGLANVVFEDRLPYAQLPARIHRADVLLGVFGTSAKAARVIPNKVFQSLACGRPVITRTSPAYPQAFATGAGHGVIWVPAGDARSLAQAVSTLVENRGVLSGLGARAYDSYLGFFSKAIIESQLRDALNTIRASTAGMSRAC